VTTPKSGIRCRGAVHTNNPARNPARIPVNASVARYQT
jgi:hypothetical protein